MPTILVTCAKYIVCIWNFIFAFTGLFIFMVGLIVEINYNHYSSFVGDRIWTVPIGLMIIGLLLGLLCFLGCCGALKENSFMILGFVLLAMLVFCFEIGLGIACYKKHFDIKDIMEGQFNMTMEQYTEREEYQHTWSIVQTELTCCGIYKPGDWELVANNLTLPSSCCRIINLSEATECTIKHAHPEGCFNKLLSIIDSNILKLTFVVLGMAGIQLLTVVIAASLFCSYR